MANEFLHQSTIGSTFESMEMNSIPQTLQTLIGNRFRRFHTNVSGKERLGSLLAGTALVATALFRPDRPSSQRPLLLGVGTALLLRGATGHCSLYQVLGIDRCDRRRRDGVPGNEGGGIL